MKEETTTSTLIPNSPDIPITGHVPPDEVMEATEWRRFAADGKTIQEVRRDLCERKLNRAVRLSLKHWMAIRGLSGATLARRLGLSRSRIDQLLSGYGSMSLNHLAAMGWALGIEYTLQAHPLTEVAP